MSPVNAKYYQKEPINDDLRNFAKSSTYLNKKISVDDSTPRQEQIFKKEKVVFKDLASGAKIDDDVDSVQHMDLSVIDDNLDFNNQSRLLNQIKMDKEKAILQIDEFDFKNKNLKPKQILLRPNRSRIAIKLGQQQQSTTMLSQASFTVSRSNTIRAQQHKQQSQSTVPPFKAKQKQIPEVLNQTDYHIRQSKKSMGSNSVLHNKTMGTNYSAQSITNDTNQRATSLVTAAFTIMDNRKKRVDAVKRGYKDNEIFDHTMTDILKVLNHKLGKRNPGSDIYSMAPLEERVNF